MNRVIFHSISLERFLRLPEAKPALEYIDGEVIQKVSPKRTHSVTQNEILFELNLYLRGRQSGRCYPEFRCTFSGRSLVPDISYYETGRVALDGSGNPLEEFQSPPDLCVEILSPGQTVRSMTSRLDWFVAHGVQLGWLVQPRKERVLVFEPGSPHRVLGRGDDLDGGTVLPGFRLTLSTLFDEVKRP